MSRRLVCDASALVAVLTDGGRDGRWATEALSGSDLYAPDLLPYEVATVLRRQAGALGEGVAAQAHADLLDLAVELWPYELVASRAWELRQNLSSYDASYVALAELLDAPLVTLDGGIASAPGTRCEILMPPRS